MYSFICNRKKKCFKKSRWFQGPDFWIVVELNGALDLCDALDRGGAVDLVRFFGPHWGLVRAQILVKFCIVVEMWICYIFGS